MKNAALPTNEPYLPGARSSARVDDLENLLRYLEQADLASSEALQMIIQNKSNKYLTYYK